MTVEAGTVALSILYMYEWLMLMALSMMEK